MTYLVFNPQRTALAVAADPTGVLWTQSFTVAKRFATRRMAYDWASRFSRRTIHASMLDAIVVPLNSPKLKALHDLHAARDKESRLASILRATGTVDTPTATAETQPEVE